MGDPAGVGPEIIMKALGDGTEFGGKYVVYGAVDILKFYNDLLKLDCKFKEIQAPEEYEDGVINVIDPNHLTMDQYEIGKLSAKCGDAAYQYIAHAIADANAGKIDAVVTAPLNKEALHMGGHNYDGHTEIFATLTGTKKYAMMFYGPLKIMHVSTHCSLREACNRATKQRVLDCIELMDKALKQTGMENPLIAVAGLNPHAGEHGLFGMEEIEEIIPAIEAAKEEGINVTGPIPPDSVFNKTLNGIYDAAIAMYHDQGHIPMKFEGFQYDKEHDRWADVAGVNITLGLPIIRSSVDHGTAFDKAGMGTANEQSMLDAIRYGVQLTTRRMKEKGEKQNA